MAIYPLIEALNLFLYSSMVYFFKGTEYVRFDFDKNEVDAGYPKVLSNKNWNKVSFSSIDAIVPWKSPILYLFNGSQYHRYNIETDQAY